MLSNKGFTIPDICKILDIGNITVYNWFNSWDNFMIEGLYDKTGQGRKRIFTESDEHIIKGFVKKHNRDLNKVRLEIKEYLKEDVSKDTIKRVLKRHNFSWLRVSKKVNGEPDPVEYEKKTIKLFEIAGR